MADAFSMSGKMTLTAVDSGETILIAAWSLHARKSHGLQVVAIEVPRLEDSESLGSPEEPCLMTCAASVANARIQVPISHMKPWFKWWLKSIRRAGRQQEAEHTALFLILPVQSGYLVRADILQMRLAGWNRTILIFSRDEPDGPVSAILAAEDTSRLDEVFDTTIGAALLNSEEGILKGIHPLDGLYHRLALPLVIDRQIARKRVALVNGGYNLTFRKHLFSAASSLGMLLVFVDEPGHWLQTRGETASLPTEFLPINMTIDHELPDRIVAAVKSFSSPVHGITTVADRYLYATARAAEMLSLPTPPAKAFEATVNKELMRTLLPLPTPDRVVCVDGDSSAASHVIVKPLEGSGSLGIFLAKNNEERRAAEDALRALGKKPVVEAYLDGPEVDVNVVLHNGRVLLTEISDNLPTTAEGFPSQFDMRSWVETGSMFPSGLPDTELALLRDTTESHLLKLGFQTSVFHCEARVIRSASMYSMAESGFPRLVASNTARPSVSPELAIIELNARAPGAKASEESNYSNGTDYYALQLLAACKDDVRFCALANPFARQLGWWGSGYVPAEKEGKFTPQAMFEELAPI